MYEVFLNINLQMFTSTLLSMCTLSLLVIILSKSVVFLFELIYVIYSKQKNVNIYFIEQYINEGESKYRYIKLIVYGVLFMAIMSYQLQKLGVFPIVDILSSTLIVSNKNSNEIDSLQCLANSSSLSRSKCTSAWLHSRIKKDVVEKVSDEMSKRKANLKLLKANDKKTKEEKSIVKKEEEDIIKTERDKTTEYLSEYTLWVQNPFLNSILLMFISLYLIKVLTYFGLIKLIPTNKKLDESVTDSL
jgi:hypothetical protein